MIRNRRVERKRKKKAKRESFMRYEGWEGFVPGKWCNKEVDVRDFIQNNYTPYEGDGSFLAPATENTKKLWQIVSY